MTASGICPPADDEDPPADDEDPPADDEVEDSPGRDCTSEANRNAVHSKFPDATRWPRATTDNLCREACASDSACAVWTWHKKSFGMRTDEWGQRCVTLSSDEATEIGRAAPSSWVTQADTVSGTCS